MWLDDAWDRLTARERDVLAKRDQGETLTAIGNALGITKERVRQIERNAERHLLDSALPDAAKTEDQIAEIETKGKVIPDVTVAKLIQSGAMARNAFMHATGYIHPTVFRTTLHDYWSWGTSSQEKRKLEVAVLFLKQDLPLTIDETRERVLAMGILPSDIDRILMIDQPGTRGLEKHALGWVHKSSRTGELAYLSLRAAGGKTIHISRLAEIADVPEHAMNENLQRNQRRFENQIEQVTIGGDWRIVA